MINVEDPDDRYTEALDVIIKLQENVESSLRRLLAFKESWSTQELLLDRLENWMSIAERGLATIHDPSGGNMRQFWVLNSFLMLKINISFGELFLALCQWR